MWHSICWEPGFGYIGYIPLETPVTTWDVRHWPSGMHMQLVVTSTDDQIRSKLYALKNLMVHFLHQTTESCNTKLWPRASSSEKRVWRSGEEWRYSTSKRNLPPLFPDVSRENAAGQIAPRSKWFLIFMVLSSSQRTCLRTVVMYLADCTATLTRETNTHRIEVKQELFCSAHKWHT